jgi:hypothetical protein
MCALPDRRALNNNRLRRPHRRLPDLHRRRPHRRGRLQGIHTHTHTISLCLRATSLLSDVALILLLHPGASQQGAGRRDPRVQVPQGHQRLLLPPRAGRGRGLPAQARRRRYHLRPSDDHTLSNSPVPPAVKRKKRQSSSVFSLLGSAVLATFCHDSPPAGPQI